MTKSEEWDKGGGRPVKFNPLGNFKLIVLLGIIVLVITLVIAFATTPVYAYIGYCDEEWSEQASLMCYVKSIFDQNEIIIDNQFMIAEKLDWNNCVQLIKKTYMYSPDVAGTGNWGYQIPSDLMDECGDMP